MKKNIIIISILSVLTIFLVGWIIEANSYKSLDYYLARLDKMKLIKNYETYYTLDNIMNTFVASLTKQNSEETYKILSRKYKLNHTKEAFESNWKNFRNLITYQSQVEYEKGEYIRETVGLLNKLYKVKDNVYVGILINTYTKDEYSVLVELDPLKKYFYILDFKPCKVGEKNEK